MTIPDFFGEKESITQNYPDYCKMLEKALRLACEMVADCADCPGAQNNWPGCGGIDGECNSDEAGCWEKYFLEEAGHETS